MFQSISNLKVRIFSDGADVNSILKMYENPLIQGFTTNPTLMHKAGIRDYKSFALDILSHINDRPISFEVFSDDFNEMYAQAREIASWGKNVYVKIPVMNTEGKPSYKLIHTLAKEGIKQNVTALLTLGQVRDTVAALSIGPSAFISVFAGRIADTGRDPLPLMTASLELLHSCPQLELIWASPRELLNIFQADSIGCHIITATHDILKKINLIGKDLHQYSQETVKMFYNDALQAGFSLQTQTLDISEILF